MRRWLKVVHETQYFYGAPVELAHHVACLCPRETDFQQVRAWSVKIEPTPDEAKRLVPHLPSGLSTESKTEVASAVLAESIYRDAEFGSSHQDSLGKKASDTSIVEADLSLPANLSCDAWGNQRLHFSHTQVHRSLKVVSEFEAGVETAPEPAWTDSLPWEKVAAALRYHAGARHLESVEFSLPSRFAARSVELAAFAREAFRPGRKVYVGARELMQIVHTRFKYEPHSTSVNTTAHDALAMRRGVCQDFAHVMIAACRSVGLAARYVSGYLLTHPPKGQARLIGADASHAWMEIWCPVQGWLPLDPTNNVVAGQDHVTLAWGRDYWDVAPLRGVIRGGGRSVPAVAVTVMPLAEWEASLSKQLAHADGAASAEKSAKERCISTSEEPDSQELPP